MASSLPSYIASATPVPLDQRQPWYKNTAPTYAGIFLWFVFWHDIVTGGMKAPPPGGTLASGVGVALVGIVIAALVCHLLFYVVPGLLGMKTGLPLYVVGTSTYGAQGGFLMPGFLMGILQFGWLGVNAFFASMLLFNAFVAPESEIAPASSYPVAGHAIIAIIWVLLAAFLGLKGIRYVAKVATFLPLVPLCILLFLLARTWGGIADFDAEALVAKQQPGSGLGAFGVLALISTYIVGFFATAGAAGVDFGMNNRNRGDVQMGGLIGIALASLVAAGLSLLVVAGIYGSVLSAEAESLQTTKLMGVVVGEEAAGVLMTLLAVAAFPPACFSSFIAANSFKTTLPNVNPFISVGVGAAVSILLAVTGWAGDVMAVFQVIGASFGPVCGAMMADYLLAGGKWPGPRAGFNVAGWISWILGFVVGMLPLVFEVPIPAAPVVAFLVGLVVYAILAKAGLEGERLEMPQVVNPEEQAAAEA